MKFHTASPTAASKHVFKIGWTKSSWQSVRKWRDLADDMTRLRLDPYTIRLRRNPEDPTGNAMDNVMVKLLRSSNLNGKISSQDQLGRELRLTSYVLG